MKINELCETTVHCYWTFSCY